eukprot:scaffold285025_cov19-Tisochrysis_lutea.AAC.1
MTSLTITSRRQLGHTALHPPFNVASRLQAWNVRSGTFSQAGISSEPSCFLFPMVSALLKPVSCIGHTCLSSLSGISVPQ